MYERNGLTLNVFGNIEFYLSCSVTHLLKWLCCHHNRFVETRTNVCEQYNGEKYRIDRRTNEQKKNHYNVCCKTVVARYVSIAQSVWKVFRRNINGEILFVRGVFVRVIAPYQVKRSKTVQCMRVGAKQKGKKSAT